MKLIAAIRLRGVVRVAPAQKKTMELLRLYKKNFCIIVPENDSIKGMLEKVKDYITYGEVSEEIYKKVIDERGEEYKDRTECSKGKIKYKFIDIDGKKIKPFFRLHPPKGGFEKGGIKVPLTKGGALGDRKEKMGDLILKML
jgi:large subunit ribosomal protein L30